MIGSLFSGVGGLELGLECAGLGPVAWQVEIDPFCRLVLQKHWPDAARFEDVRNVGATELAHVDVICGGFPCQDVSGAGRGAGLTGARSGLWSEYARIVGELLPRWVVVENVTSGATRWLDEIVRELDQLGYECLPIPLSARDVGALHLRRRLFIVANRRGIDGAIQSGWRIRENRTQTLRIDCPSGARGTAHADSKFGGPRQVSQGSKRAGWTESGGGASADIDGARQLQSQGHVGEQRGWPGNSVARHIPDTLQAGSPGAFEECGKPQKHGPSVGAWGAPESDVAPVVHGVSSRLAGRQRRRRIRALGNSVVPQCAEVVGWVIRELEQRRHPEALIDLARNCGGPNA